MPPWTRDTLPMERSSPLMACHLSNYYWRVFEKLARQVIF